MFRSPQPDTMPVFEREVRVSAPLSDVWEFHATADGLVALTPDWMHLRDVRPGRP